MVEHGALFLFPLRITVNPRLKIQIKIAFSAKRHCNTDKGPLYIYDGPGVLSEKLKAKNYAGYSVYKAPTYQVFAINIAAKKQLFSG